MSHDDFDLFKSAMSGVQPIRPSRKATFQKPKPSSTPKQPTESPASMWTATPIHTSESAARIASGDLLSFRRNHIAPTVLKQLRRGQIEIASELDLHGLTETQAQQQIGRFLEHAHQQRWLAVRIIHGKGFGSQTTPVLKTMVNNWLPHLEIVMAFCSAKPADGGAGAVNVLLQR